MIFCMFIIPVEYLEHFLKKCIRRTHAHVQFRGHWYPCFGFVVTSPLGFKAKMGFALFTFAETNVMSNP